MWIAIDDATPENGCMKVVPGSHRAAELLPHVTENGDYTLFRRVEDVASAEANARDVILERGQVSIHDVYMIHGSRPNKSSKPRRGITFRYMPTTSHFNEKSRKYDLNGKLVREHGEVSTAHRKLFLMRGVDRSGKNRIVNFPQNLEAFWDVTEAGRLGCPKSGRPLQC